MRPLITPQTKVASLLNDFPELEDTLIAMAPPFAKLRNPILRRSVAKVASLRQAAAVARLDVVKMVNELRSAVGQPLLEADNAPAREYFGEAPTWFDETRIVGSIDERELDPDVMPLAPVMRRAVKLAPGELLELVTSHLPAPGIDLLLQKGYAVWSLQGKGEVKTYVAKST